jgi:hypothetical protein
MAGGPAFELEFSGASSFAVFEGAGFRFPDPQITGHSEDQHRRFSIRILSGVRSCDLHEVASKPGPLQTKGSGTRKFKPAPKAAPPASPEGLALEQLLVLLQSQTRADPHRFPPLSRNNAERLKPTAASKPAKQRPPGRSKPFQSLRHPPLNSQ